MKRSGTEGNSSNSRPQFSPLLRFKHMEALKEWQTPELHSIRAIIHSNYLYLAARTCNKYRLRYKTAIPNRSQRFRRYRCNIQTRLSLKWCKVFLIFHRSYRLDCRLFHRTLTNCHRSRKRLNTMLMQLLPRQYRNNQIGLIRETSSPGEELRLSRRKRPEKVVMTLEPDRNADGDG